MHTDYSDIKNLTDLEPDWYDQNGVPRYAPFAPKMVGVYNKYALYVKIGCQACHQTFNVADGWTAYDFTLFNETWDETNFKAIANQYHYGDPPAHNCMGDTMNCIDLHIVEAWSKTGWDWKRQPDIEKIDITQDWAK